MTLNQVEIKQAIERLNQAEIKRALEKNRKRDKELEEKIKNARRL